MIVSHRLIKQLSPFQVFELLKILGKWSLENRKGGLNLPRFPINLVGTPPNVKIARLILHSAAEEDVVLKQFFRFFLSKEHSNLLKGTESTKDIEPDTKDWGANASWVLNYLHDKLLIEFKNQIWQVECMSELILGNPEVRELIQLIRIDTSKIQANLIVLDSNVGKIVMGDETNVVNNYSGGDKKTEADKSILEITLNGDIENFQIEEQESVINYLKKITNSNDEIHIIDVKEGSIIIRIETTERNARLILELISSGRIKSLEGFDIASVFELNMNKSSSYNSTNIDIVKIEKELENGETEKAITILYGMCQNDENKRNQLILLKSRYKLCRKDYALGIQTYDEHTTQIQRINEAILFISKNIGYEKTK